MSGHLIEAHLAVRFLLGVKRGTGKRVHEPGFTRLDPGSPLQLTVHPPTPIAVSAIADDMLDIDLVAPAPECVYLVHLDAVSGIPAQQHLQLVLVCG